MSEITFISQGYFFERVERFYQEFKQTTVRMRIEKPPAADALVGEAYPIRWGYQTWKRTVKNGVVLWYQEKSDE